MYYAIGYDDDGQAYVILARGNQKINVEVEQYGRNYVKVLSGLSGGEILLQASEIPKSGSAANRNRNQQGGMPDFGGSMPNFGGSSGGSGSGRSGGSSGGGGMPNFGGGGMPF